MSFSSQLIPWYREAQVYLSTTLAHPAWLPFPILDILGAIRLSVFIDQIVRQENGITRADGNVEEERKRPSFLQEAFGISVLVFGGETFLAPCLGIMPSWLVSPNGLLLFSVTHYLVTRTPLHRLVPRTASLSHELPLSIHDSLGRALVLTTLSFDLIRSHPSSHINSNGYLMLIAGWIIMVPFAAATFAFGLFSKHPKYTTPAELQPGGWMAVDFWAPFVIAYLYGMLTGAHEMFMGPWHWMASVQANGTTGKTGFWDPADAKAACAAVLTVCFALRAVYHFGGTSQGIESHVGQNGNGVAVEHGDSREKAE